MAALRFAARAPVGPRGDIVDAVAAGVNFLGEELYASFNEIERRVADRTEELLIATKEAGRRALHDQLTGLPNRVLFWEHLSIRVKLARRRKTGFAVLFLDLDDFKSINDGRGHAAGDQVLQAVAGVMTKTLPDAYAIGRIGGDEFGLRRAARCACPPRSRPVLHALRGRRTRPSRKRCPDQRVVPGEPAAGADRRQLVDEQLAAVTSCSIGGATFDQDGDSLDALLRVADHRAYAVKQRRSNRQPATAAEPMP